MNERAAGNKTKIPVTAGIRHWQKSARSQSVYDHFAKVQTVPSIFECINQKAEAVKAQRWIDYQPLNPSQLSDKLDEDNYITILNDPAFTSGSDRRSTTAWDGAKMLSQFVILKRPTEARAIKHAQHQITFASEDAPIAHLNTLQERWCCFCKARHNPSAFIRHHRYLHGISYACKQSIQAHKRSQWRYLGETG